VERGCRSLAGRQRYCSGPKVEPVEAQYHDDLSAFFKLLTMQRQGEAIASFYVDDLPAFFRRLKER
jgi:hypothetical protein